jgi:tRNA modification GTPase
MSDLDTIVAAASPPGRGAVALLRLSGPAALELARRLCPGPPRWQPRRLSLRCALDAEGAIDQLLVAWMPGPHSYTGEDVVELSCHGNPLLVEALIARCVELGARPARAGEYSRRALLNGRMDLLQAEALAGLIESRSPLGLRAAQSVLDGQLSASLERWRDRLLDMVAELESRLDHPGEELGRMDDEALCAALQATSAEAATLASSWGAGRRMLQGARVALAGPVNAGKSSLFNRLLGEERALVSPEPGTTRDVVEKTLLVEGLEFTLLDTAGEREDPGQIEAAGIALGRRLSAEVDLRLWVVPLHQAPWPEPPPSEIPTWWVGTHADLAPQREQLPIELSNRTGEGLEELRRALRGYLLQGAGPRSAELVLLSHRQAELVGAVSRACAEAALALAGPAGPAVAAEELIDALGRLGELVGADVREEVLDRLFSRFCIGK